MSNNNSDLISRSAILRKLRIKVDEKNFIDGLFAAFSEVVCEKIIEPETAADAVEVVRCKECKHSAEISSYGCYCRRRDTPWFNDIFEVYMDVDDFCSYGERRDGE